MSSFQKYDYSNYWEDSLKKREEYYSRIYSKIRRFYKTKPGESILDVAGGNGQLSNYLGFKKVTLLDISDSGIKIARKKFKYKAKKSDLLNESWPIREKYFDIAICNEFLEHVSFPSLILSRINSCLKKRGTLYVAGPNMTPDGVHHVKRITWSYLNQILLENGFKIVASIIVPKFLTLTFSEISFSKKPKDNLKIFFGAFLGIFFSKKTKFKLAKIFPNFFGGFYHIKAEKIN